MFVLDTNHVSESKPIAMSLEWPADLLIMDESSGRAMFRNLNIRITGTLGALLILPLRKTSQDRTRNAVLCR